MSRWKKDVDEMSFGRWNDRLGAIDLEYIFILNREKRNCDQTEKKLSPGLWITMIYCYSNPLIIIYLSQFMICLPIFLCFSFCFCFSSHLPCRYFTLQGGLPELPIGRRGERILRFGWLLEQRRTKGGEIAAIKYEENTSRYENKQNNNRTRNPLWSEKSTPSLIGDVSENNN